MDRTKQQDALMELNRDDLRWQRAKLRLTAAATALAFAQADYDEAKRQLDEALEQKGLALLRVTETL